MLLISHFISHLLFIAAKNSNGKKGETNDEKAAKKKSVLKKGEKNDEKKSKGR